MVTKRRKTGEELPEKYVEDIVNLSLSRLGWEPGEKDDDDSLFIRAVIPTVIDSTLDVTLDYLKGNPSCR